MSIRTLDYIVFM